MNLVLLLSVKELCDEIEKCQQLVALRLEGNTINEEAATAIGKALEKHSEIEVNRIDRLMVCDKHFLLASHLE